jgi:hypothetical protein
MMSIPLDRLYAYIERVSEQIHGDVVELLRFYPHGSKNIDDLLPIKTITGYVKYTSPLIVCNDQEPLNFEQYQDVTPSNVPEKHRALIKKYNLKKYSFQFQRLNIYDCSLLIHSEKNSADLDKYCQDGFIPVYYWSHAVLALDWFRYAQHIQQNKQSQKTFLIYNRAWAGTREYRLKLAELLINQNLASSCKTTINTVEPELNIHYTQHKFKNPVWKPGTVLENSFPISKATSCYSADFDIADYESTDIEVVLETLFDDSRLHLTEKVLRPIACAQPFILAGTSGSLQYLRSYGFQTYHTVWDESYDLIEDPQQRLLAIVEVMKKIQSWTPAQREQNLARCREISEHNRQHFFSQEFFNLVITELETNLKSALEELETTNTSAVWINRRKKLWQLPEFRADWYNFGPETYWPNRTRQDIAKVIARARHYYNRSTGSTDI